MEAVITDLFYWVSIALMICIHAGFLAYEVGASRSKNVLAAAMKNLLTFSVVCATFFFFGWWFYNAFYQFPVGAIDTATAALPWSDDMGPNNSSVTGIFWGAFALFAATTGSILSGAVLERIRTSAFLILTTVLGSVVWIIGAAWAWHGSGWLLTEWGWHDFGAAGCVHLIAGAFTLGVLINLGPRIGRFVDGKAITIPPHNLPLTMLGLMLIFVGFFGFLMGCVVYTNTGYFSIFGNQTTLSAVAFSTLMGLAGGILGAYVSSKGEPFWTISGGLAGVISVAPGMDLYHPALAFIIAVAGGLLIPYFGKAIEKFGIDDVVGAVAVHGGCAAFGIVVSGFVLWGYPNVAGYPDINPLGQIGGFVVLALLGFLPGYVLSLALKKAKMLRIPAAVELAGLDLSEVPATPYPEGIPVTILKSDTEVTA
ncbi:ammonium transporter [Nocardioides sp. GY 10127]|uniref:ammonium transporter n=1 Tax=Nocardioides sp. GY 10127 TaxID=2569762 RepID=UPI0010A83C33|nr:ammonium transporter [Nocardioides sp. GY 10127]TIC79913.1 ammonium transporter [Nocardioides sp. GY 10127]